MSGVPKELDETAYVDGYSFWRFFFKIFVPTIAAGIGVAAFFCFMFSWVELLLAKTLTSVAAKPIAATMTRTASTSGYELGLLAAAGTLTIIPGAFVIYFVRNYIAKGFALHGRVGMARSRRRPAARHSGPRHDPGRPAVHFPARLRLHPARMARRLRRASLGRRRPVSAVRIFGVPLGLGRGHLILGQADLNVAGNSPPARRI